MEAERPADEATKRLNNSAVTDIHSWHIFALPLAYTRRGRKRRRAIMMPKKGLWLLESWAP
jgi:hypothetical protein